MTLREKQNVGYWTDFYDYLSRRSNDYLLPSLASRKKHFIDFRIGTGCFLRARQVIKSKSGPTAITVGFIMKGRARTYFHGLKGATEGNWRKIWWTSWMVCRMGDWKTCRLEKRGKSKRWERLVSSTWVAGRQTWKVKWGIPLANWVTQLGLCDCLFPIHHRRAR